MLDGSDRVVRGVRVAALAATLSDRLRDGTVYSEAGRHKLLHHELRSALGDFLDDPDDGPCHAKVHRIAVVALAYLFELGDYDDVVLDAAGEAFEPSSRYND